MVNVFERHAPIKKHVARANKAPYMTKALRKAIATRPRLENKFHCKRIKDSVAVFKKPNKYCS